MAGRNDGGRSTTSSYPAATKYKVDVNIVERVWDVQPSGSTPKAGLVILHGGMWHSGWFGELGDLLSSSEYSIRVSAPDLIAHGMSDDVLPGYRNYCPDFAEHALEARAAVARARSALPENTPVFLLGESMGGLIALQHLIIHETDVEGVILCGAVLQIAPALLPPSFVMPILRGLSWLVPTMAVPGQDVGGETFDRAFGDPEVGPVARLDPLVVDKEPPRLGYMMSALGAMDLVKTNAADMLKVKSVLMLHYKGDERVIYEACKSLVDSMPSEDKVIVPLDGTNHQVFQDTKEKSRGYGEIVGRFIIERAT